MPRSPLALAFALLFPCSVVALESIPDKLVVLTFDDSVASQYHQVRPLLKKHGFGATFFVTEGFTFRTNKTDYMTWEQIAELHRDGFEIGNHTRDHMSVTANTLNRLKEQVEAIDARCAEHGIPKPVSFAYPGNGIHPEALPILRELGFKFARRGGAPEHAYDWGRGYAYEPGKDHPLLIPSAGDARPDWSLADFQCAVAQATSGRIAVLQFHGAPDREHPWVNTPFERFAQYMDYLKSQRFQVVALRDLAKYVDPADAPADPLAIVRKRQTERTDFVMQGEIVDAETGRPLPARISIQSPDGKWFFPKSASSSGSAIRYERKNGAAEEMHTTLSAHPFRVELVPGKYIFAAHRGKEYLPARQEIEVTAAASKITLKLKRWINMNELGWFSGDGHNHRNPADLANVLPAEDLNVALPMVDWTTDAAVPPIRSGRGFPAEQTGPQKVGGNHVWYPRNTEYEIFRTAGTNHTLGALLILNHRSRFELPALPIGAVAKRARDEGALLDLEKHNWPWSIALVPIAQVNLFELGNNHHWQAPYAIRNWAVPAPDWMKLTGGGTSTELGWTLYGFQTFYALLNAGFELKPSAGTANGVHPVPLGFSRVYVQVDGDFTYEKWVEGLARGRSFVTTGPMLFATADRKHPGSKFSNTSGEYDLECSVRSEHALQSLELIVNGAVEKSFGVAEPGRPGTSARHRFKPARTSWAAWRCFESLPGDRIRFAHSAPFYFEVPGTKLVARKAEARWLVDRVREEIARSKAVAPRELIAEYEQALAVYEKIEREAE